MKSGDNLKILEIGKGKGHFANLFLRKWRGLTKIFFCPFLPTENSMPFPKKEWKKVRKTPLVEMTDGVQKESGFPTQIPVKQGEREAGRGKVEQIVNKKIIKIQPPKSAA